MVTACESEPRVLCVNDDPVQLKLLEAHLRQAGCRVSRATGGVEALEAARHEPPDLIISDVVMPQANGREVAGRLTALRPAMRVVFMSGYSEAVVRDGVLEEGVNFIQKPFTTESLLWKLREVLDAPPPARPRGARLPAEGGGA